MIVLNIFLNVEPSQNTQFANLLTEMTNQTKQDAGNDYADYFCRDNKYIIVQYWQDEAALDTHNQSEHMNQFISQVMGLLSDPIQIEKYSTH